MLITDIASMAGQTAFDGGHGAVTGGTVDGIANLRGARVILLRQMVRCANLTQVAGQTFVQDTNITVALGAVTGQSRSRLVVLVLLRHKVVTLRAVATGGHADMALVTESLLSGSRFVVLVRHIIAVTLGTITRLQVGERGRCCCGSSGSGLRASAG